MLASVKQFFNDYIAAEDDPDDEHSHGTEIAAAALLIEVGRADFDFSDDEETRVLDYLRSVLDIDERSLQALIVVAREQSTTSTSLHGFTSLVHDNYSQQQKQDLMQQLWRVALADGRIDRYEDYVLRKIAELIYLSHQEFIQAKLRAQQQLSASQ